VVPQFLIDDDEVLAPGLCDPDFAHIGEIGNRRFRARSSGGHSKQQQ
jgi:hypothetical protein